MEIRRDFPTSFLKPAPYNPRIMDEEEHEELNEAIEYFGLVDPIIFNTDTGVIIGGNQRYEHIKGKEKGFALILGDIGWFFTQDNLVLESEADEKALNVTLNQLSGKFDNKLLMPVVEDILDADVPLIGFSDEELNKILEPFDEEVLEDSAVNENVSTEYEGFEEKHKGQTFYLKEGDEWVIGNNRLIVGPVDENQKFNLAIKGNDMKITVSSVENVDEEMFLFLSKNKKVIEENHPKYKE